MATVTLGIKVDESLRTRIKAAAERQGRTPHALIKLAVLGYIESVERGVQPTADAGRDDSATSLVLTDETAGHDAIDLGANPAPPFMAWAQGVLAQTELRAAITAAWHRPEPECLPALLHGAQVTDTHLQQAISTLATRLVERLRQRRDQGGVEALVQEFSLSSQEGVALMCMAEALLRIPDMATRDALIRDKISRGDWQAHLGHSPSMFVNAAAWGLMLTGKLTTTRSEKTMMAALTRLIGKGGEPLIRQGVHRAMKLMGEQFVTGQTIAEALANSRTWEKKGFRYSYDMLGEAAATEADAVRYLASYEQAIHAIGQASGGRGIYEGPGISIKLSALHPRYQRAQRERVMAELLPRLLKLATLARHYDIGMNIDAEEADRLELSLDLLESLCFEPSLKGWHGIGFVIQAYQKRCPYLIDYLIDLARRSGRRLMIRLVKGAYWDSEIKRAQLDGLPGYPVYTRKVYTDVAYVACARKLLAAPDAIYPQFATHNAQTLATIYHLAGSNFYPGQYEFQCLHGMGEPLYEQVCGPISEGKLGRPCRVYAPVGTHETLLAYLVRRLLENGANTSFVNRIGDPKVPVAELVSDPVDDVRRIEADTGLLGAPHPKIPLPRDLFGQVGSQSRRNSMGMNLSHEQQLSSLAAGLLHSAQQHYLAAPTSTDTAHLTDDAWAPVLNPANLMDRVGRVRVASIADVDRAVALAVHAAPIWQVTPPHERAACLRRAADLLEQRMQEIIGLVVREAGKTVSNAISEVREAVDFLRYYAAQVEALFDNQAQRPLGVVLCISPWNFPLAIFAGQVAAALACGNSVLAKPAEQTPLTAAVMVNMLHEAGVPQDALHLLPGPGESVGAALVAHAQVGGVMFTGSTEVARLIAQALAKRLSPQGRCVPLIAETGGQNAMVVDSSALAEQVVADVLSSAFDSAGQRCSALRLLCVQEDIAERLVDMIRAALEEWIIGSPDQMNTDIGPVIDDAARSQIEQHIDRLKQEGMKVTRVARDARQTGQGFFVLPAVIEIDRIERLQREVFGPVLHVLRYRREHLPQVLNAINAAGYGLTAGVHSRIDETIQQVCRSVHAGNLYVNRNVIGAVVGVQPFGGMGLSGTGPKAGGPLYLYRLLQLHEAQGNAALEALPSQPQSPHPAPTTGLPAADPTQAATRQAAEHLLETARQSRLDAFFGPETSAQDRAKACQVAEAYLAQTPIGRSWVLPGPTGEANLYHLLGRGPVWCVPQTPVGLFHQVMASLSSGNACWVDTRQSAAAELWKRLGICLPTEVSNRVRAVNAQDLSAPLPISVLLFEGDRDTLLKLSGEVAALRGPLVRIESLTPAQLHRGVQYDLSALLHEQSISVNTAAAGGNAQLMTLS